MFLKTSRYFGLPTVLTSDRRGREVQAVKLRRVPQTAGEPAVVRSSDQLDVIAETLYRDPVRYWHVADANSELEANELTRRAGRVIKVPNR